MNNMYTIYLKRSLNTGVYLGAIILLIFAFALTACGEGAGNGGQEATLFVAVDNISGVPATAIAGTPLELTGTVTPENATNRAITWSVLDAGTSGANILGGNILTTTAAGTAIVTATIANGAAQGVPYTQSFVITVSPQAVDFVPVTAINATLPETMIFADTHTLSGTVSPSNATDQTINWSVTSGAAFASISGNTLTANAPGSVVVTASVANGIAEGQAFTRDFNITINPPLEFVPVTAITGVPLTAIAGLPHTLFGTVMPANASLRNIVWSVINQGTTGATISGNTLNATAAGIATVRATITNGTAFGTDYTQDFDIMVQHIPVTAITGVQTTATARVPFTLTGIVAPANASNRDIVWSVAVPGTTEAAIDGNTLTTTAAGIAIVRATITNGLAQGIDFTEDFNITVNYVPVTSIANVQTTATARVDFTLAGTVMPANASNRNIGWSVYNAGTTGATINGNTLNTTAGGTATVRATITNGLALGTDFTQNFTITVAYEPVTNITGVPLAAIARVPLTLAGTVLPANASNQDIVWSVFSQGTTGATISGNTLNTTAGGTATVRATITNGTALGTDYTQNFEIRVIEPVTGISGVPSTATAGTPLTLTGTVAPANASYQSIVWSMFNAGTTGATINGNVFNATAAGTATVRATINNGMAVGISFTQNFEIIVSYTAGPFTVVFDSGNNELVTDLTGDDRNNLPLGSSLYVRLEGNDFEAPFEWFLNGVRLQGENSASIELLLNSINLIRVNDLTVTFHRNGIPHSRSLKFRVVW